MGLAQAHPNYYIIQLYLECTFPVTSTLKDMDDIRFPCVVRALTWPALLLKAPLMNSIAALEIQVVLRGGLKL